MAVIAPPASSARPAPVTAGVPSPSARTGAHGAPHLVDATMFWNPRGGGGVRRYLYAKRDVLSRMGWRHTIVAPGARGPGTVDCGGWPVPASAGYRFPWRRDALARRIAEQAPDIVEAGDPYLPGWAALDAARACRVPSVLFCHSNLPAMVEQAVARRLPRGLAARAAAPLSRAAGRYMAELCLRHDVVLAPSRAMQRTLRDLGVHHAQYQPLGVDTRVFTPTARDERWRHRLDLPPGTWLLLYVGRFAPEKHLDVLVAALERLGPRYHLLAMGQGPCPPRGPRVRVLPHASRPQDVARAMASADGFVHAGDAETFGLSVLEAMACGTPVAVRWAAGLAETVANGRGIGVRSDRPEDWADAIEALPATPRAQLAAAVAHARAHDWTEVLTVLHDRYARAIAEVSGLAREAARLA